MTNRDTPADVARDLAVHVRHLRDFRGVAYVGLCERSASPASPARAAAVDGRGATRNQAHSWSAATKLEYLRRRNVGDCNRCALSRRRTNIVFGVGNPDADLIFVGEAPGADEDRRGEPFVGRAGQRLDQWIEAVGLRREDVYIANVLKCRPPGNRDPEPGEVDTCSRFLQAQIRAVEPRAIVALGRHAGMLLSRRDDMPLRTMRTSKLVYRDPKHDDVQVPLFVTYHPAFVLRKESDPKEAERFTSFVLSDLKRALSVAPRE